MNYNMINNMETFIKKIDKFISRYKYMHPTLSIRNKPLMVKKVGKEKRFEIDGFRAGGLIPYILQNKQILILVNTEHINKKIVKNSIGGKVDETDKNIEGTILREFNEETGFLMKHITSKYYDKFNEWIRIPIYQSKYLAVLYHITDDIDEWLDLPLQYSVVYDGTPIFENHRESVSLEWIDLLNDNSEKSYMLNTIISSIKKQTDICKMIKEIDPNYDDEYLFI